MIDMAKKETIDTKKLETTKGKFESDLKKVTRKLGKPKSFPKSPET